MSRTLLLLFAALSVSTSRAFVVTPHAKTLADTTSTAHYVFGGKKKNDDEDLSFIESRDMTREEMLELNKQNEDIMNAELWGMTIFSLIISIPMLYLVWVGFFSETVEFGEL